MLRRAIRLSMREGMLSDALRFLEPFPVVLYTVTHEVVHDVWPFVTSYAGLKEVMSLDIKRVPP